MTFLAEVEGKADTIIFSVHYDNDHIAIHVIRLKSLRTNIKRITELAKDNTGKNNKTMHSNHGIITTYTLFKQIL
jgi:hypothetical protein